MSNLRSVYSEFPVVDGIVACPDWFLDGHVYRSCPECGGSRVVRCARCKGVGEERAPLAGVTHPCPLCHGNGKTICPACADAPVAIVSAALRERARDALWAQEDTRDLMPAEVWLDAAVDAVLSTVLGHIEYKEAEKTDE